MQNNHKEMIACNRGKNHNDNTFFITNPGSQKKLAKHCFKYWNKRPVNPEFYLQWKDSSRRKKNQSISEGLVVQWLRLHLPMKEVWIQSLVRELKSYVFHDERNKNVKQKQYCNKCSKTFLKNGPHQK